MGSETADGLLKLQATTQRNGPGSGGTLRGRDTGKDKFPMPPQDTASAVTPHTPTTRVVHVNDGVPDAVYIGRSMSRRKIPGSKWGNPYQIKNYRRPEARAYVIDLYRVEITTGGKALLASLPELRGKPLACWCRHDGEERTEANACHGDVLVDLLTRYTDEELREMAAQP